MTIPTLLVAVGSPESNKKWAQAFKQLQPTWRVLCWDEVEGRESADFAVVWRPSAQLFIDQPQLKAIFNIGAGVDGINFEQIPPHLPVYRIEDAGMAVQMAEYALHGVLLATQRFTTYQAQQQQGLWAQANPIYRHEWPIGVLGFGQIGKKVAELLQRLGYPVAAWARTARPEADPSAIACFAGADQLAHFLAQSRILINVLPLTPDTTGIINQGLLSQLPPKSFVINMARGGHVVDADLIAALDSGHITGALLDVFHTEPLPIDHAFWQHPLVHITPHAAGMSLLEPTAQQIQSKIQSLLNHQVVTGLVDTDRRY